MSDAQQGISSPVNPAEGSETLGGRLGELIRRKRGRPPGSKNKSLSPSVSENPPENKAVDSSPVVSTGDKPVNPPVAPIDRELVEKSLASIFRTIDGVIVNKIHRIAYMATKDESVSQGIAKEGGMTKDELGLLSGLGATIAEKHAILGQYAPEVLFSVAFLGYSARAYMAINGATRLLKLSLEKKAAENAA